MYLIGLRNIQRVEIVMAIHAGFTQLIPSRHTVVTCSIDALISSSSVAIALVLRVGSHRAVEILGEFPLAVPLFLVIAMATFGAMRTHRRLWRFVSVDDVVEIAKGATLAITAYVLLLLVTGHLTWLPRSIPAILWLVQVAMMGGVRVLGSGIVGPGVGVVCARLIGVGRGRGLGCGSR